MTWTWIVAAESSLTANFYFVEILDKKSETWIYALQNTGSFTVTLCLLFWEHVVASPFQYTSCSEWSETIKKKNKIKRVPYLLG